MRLISARLDNMDKILTKLVEVQQCLLKVEEGMQFTSEYLNMLAARITESLTHQILRKDVHCSKWNIIILDIEGPAGELEHTTCAKCFPICRGGP